MINEIRQGDVVLKPVNNIPEGAREVKMKKGEKSKILQSSETQGKYHHFHGNAAVKIYETETNTEDMTITLDTGKFLHVVEDSTLFHGRGFKHTPNEESFTDHHSITVPSGLYQVIIIREYDYVNHCERTVVD